MRDRLGDDRRLGSCHHPRKRMIQYAAAHRLYLAFPEYWMPAFAGMTTLDPLLLAPSPHEVEIAAFVGLQNGLVEEMRVAAPGPFRRGDGLERRTALVEFGGIDQEIDASLLDIEPDHVAVLHQRQGTAGGRFRRDVQHDGAERRAAHPRIRDPHHVLDAGAPELL